jgi:DNA-binding CsgD family transcriptional regulator
MEVHPIDDGEFGGDTLGCQAVGLVDAVGRPEFSSALFRLAHDAVGCEHVTAFSLDGSHTPRVVLAENAGNGRIASSLAQKYATQYWRLDPANRVFGRIGAAHDCWGLRIAASDITDSVYRNHCYKAVGLDHRLSIVQIRSGRTYRLNFYRGRRQPFSSEAAARVFDAADMLMALIRRHDAESDVSQCLTKEALTQRLRIIAPDLPARELEVMALIASGLSSHGIALELRISVNTVLTYRKRAYSRLDISTQNELMQLLLRTRSPM